MRKKKSPMKKSNSLKKAKLMEKMLKELSEEHRNKTGKPLFG